ncbi:MAG: PHP domain-containing protein [Bdellovibrionales bacterium]|nr:PHP domain-containing protein [Bdellovibrionales bacterium]
MKHISFIAIQPRVFWWLVPVLFCFELYSLFPTRIAREPGNYLRGVYHVHSQFSHDATGSLEHIAEAANQAALDFVVVTDHNSLQGHHLRLDKQYGAVDLYVETEASLPMGHAVSFLSHTTAADTPDREIEEKTLRQLIQKIPMAEGTFQVIAHPTNVKRPWERLDLFAKGVEVINLDSVWREQLNTDWGSSFVTLLLYPLNEFVSMLRLLKVNPKNFQIWDNMNSVSKNHVGLLAQDTHENVQLSKNVQVLWPTYRETFKLASNIVFLDRPRADTYDERKRQTYEQIQKGRVAMVFDYLYPFQNSNWTLRCGDKVAHCGEEIPLSDGGCVSEVQTPDGFPYPLNVKLLRNGRETASSNRITEPGTYRVEVWAKIHSRFSLLVDEWIPFTFYNPIYVQ